MSIVKLKPPLLSLIVCNLDSREILYATENYPDRAIWAHERQ